MICTGKLTGKLPKSEKIKIKKQTVMGEIRDLRQKN